MADRPASSTTGIDDHTAAAGHHDRRARCSASIVFQDIDLWLGEFETRNRVEALADQALCGLRLKFEYDVGPNPSDLAGREFVIPFQALTELTQKQERKHASDGGRRVVSHAEAPIVSVDTEVEITPEMIEAGIEKFWNHCDLKFGGADVAVFAIFKAMVSASPKLRHKGRGVQP